MLPPTATRLQKPTTAHLTPLTIKSITTYHHQVRLYARFVSLASMAIILGRCLSFEAPMKLLNGSGLCVLDVAVVSGGEGIGG
jgi:hypothetical protein